MVKNAETRRNLHTHAHTHTCNLLLSPKQIGTICFAIFSFVFSAPSFADPDIPSSASTADCKNVPLETYSGTSNLQANWQANTIALHWYNGDTELTVAPESQSCVYDGTLTPPATIPQREGYIFKGWRVRQQPSVCPFVNSVCGLTGSDVNGLTYVDGVYDDYVYTNFNGSSRGSLNANGVTTLGSWAAKDTNGGIVKGIASCNGTSGSQLWETCNSYTFKLGNTFSNDVSGDYCWCKLESYTPSGGPVCNLASPSWVYETSFASGACAMYCAFYCVISFMFDDGDDDFYADVFRRALFGVSQ